MSVSEKLTAIADAIRDKTGGIAPLTLDGMAAEISAVYEKGYTAGEDRHRAIYHVERRAGENIPEISFSCPFEPDAVLITTFSPLSASQLNSFKLCLADLRSFGRYSGFLYYSNSQSFLSSNANTSTVRNLFIYENGTFTFKAPTQLAAVKFNSAMTYTIVAVRYEGVSDIELLSGEVETLTAGGGSVMFSKSRVLSTVSEARWEEMIADKRADGWTISLV